MDMMHATMSKPNQALYACHPYVSTCNFTWTDTHDDITGFGYMLCGTNRLWMTLLVYRYKYCLQTVGSHGIHITVVILLPIQSKSLYIKLGLLQQIMASK